MKIYQLSDGCCFRSFRRAWLILVRAECACGYLTRPYLTADGASDALIRHQAQAGTRVA